MRSLLITATLIFSSTLVLAGGAPSLYGDYFLFYAPLIAFVVMVILEYLWKLTKSKNVLPRLKGFILHQFRLLKEH